MVVDVPLEVALGLVEPVGAAVVVLLTLVVGDSVGEVDGVCATDAETEIVGTTLSEGVMVAATEGETGEAVDEAVTEGETGEAVDEAETVEVSVNDRERDGKTEPVAVAVEVTEKVGTADCEMLADKVDDCEREADKDDEAVSVEVSESVCVHESETEPVSRAVEDTEAVAAGDCEMLADTVCDGEAGVWLADAVLDAVMDGEEDVVGVVEGGTETDSDSATATPESDKLTACGDAGEKVAGVTTVRVVSFTTTAPSHRIPPTLIATL